MPITPSRQKVLESDPWIVPSYLSRAANPRNSHERAMDSIFMAFMHSEKFSQQPDRGYVVFSNGFYEEIFDEEFFSEFERYLDPTRSRLDPPVRRPRPAPELAKKFKNFVNEKLVLLAPGSQALSTEQVRGLFHPKNGALFVQASGYGSLADALSVGTFPMMQYRRYHRSFAESFKELVVERVADKHGEKVAVRVDDYLEDVGRESLMGRYVANRVRDSIELAPVLSEAAADIRQHYNLSSYVSDAVDVFIQAKRIQPDDVAAGVIFGLDKSKGSQNRFFKNLLEQQSTLENQYLDLVVPVKTTGSTPRKILMFKEMPPRRPGYGCLRPVLETLKAGGMKR